MERTNITSSTAPTVSTAAANAAAMKYPAVSLNNRATPFVPPERLTVPSTKYSAPLSHGPHIATNFYNKIADLAGHVTSFQQDVADLIPNHASDRPSDHSFVHPCPPTRTPQYDRMPPAAPSPCSIGSLNLTPEQRRHILSPPTGMLNAGFCLTPAQSAGTTNVSAKPASDFVLESPATFASARPSRRRCTRCLAA